MIEQRPQAESLWRAAVDSAKVAICITTAELDAPGPSIVYCNDAYLELFGRAREDVLGSTPRAAQGPLTDRRLLDRLRAALAAGLPFEGETVNYRRGGRPFVMHLRIEPILIDGRLIAFVGWLRDVTGQRRSEATLTATVAIDNALHDTLRRPTEPGRDLAHLARVGERCLQTLVGELGVVALRLPAVPLGTARADGDGDADGAVDGRPAAVVRRPVLGARGQVRGELCITALDEVHGRFIDLAGVDAVCLRLAGALDAVGELGRLRSTALHLQECHLPPPPTPHRRFEAVSRYQPSADAALIGGDWFDVIDTAAGPVFVIGDVMGHDVAAAADMGRLRTAMAVLIGQGMEPAEVMVEAAAFCTRQAILATALLARLGDGRLEVVSAGHPPPVLAGAGGAARFIDVVPAPPLGAWPDGRQPATSSVPVRDEEVVVLYTDGLVEARGEALPVGLESLRATLATLVELPLAELADTLVDRRRDTDRADDLALLAVRLRRSTAGG